MKILILNPSSKLTKNVVRDVLYGCWCGGKRIGGAMVPPFALLQVATVLREDGNKIEFIDMQAEQIYLEEIITPILNADIVTSSISTMTFEEDAMTLLQIKKINPKIITIVFGSHPTFLPKVTASRPGVDIAVRHEPEYILRDIARCINNGKDWRKTQGIAYRGNGNLVINPPYPFIKDLDELPFPDVSLLPKDIDYFNPIVRRMPYITTSTSRGCPGQCKFCTASSFGGNRVRFQSAEYVTKKIIYFMRQGYREIYFRDDTFFVNKKRDTKICQEIIDRKLNVSWVANARIGMIDKETIDLAKRAGCHTIKFGVESGDQAVLDKSNKGYIIEKAYETFKWAEEVDIATHAHCMLGMPGDDKKSIKKTINFVKELNATTASFGICTPYPGAALYDEVLRLYPEIGDGSSSNLSKLHISGLFNEIYADIKKEELEEYVKKAYRSFYLRPKVFYQLLKQVRTIDDIKRITLAGARILDFALFGE